MLAYDLNTVVNILGLLAVVVGAYYVIRSKSGDSWKGAYEAADVERKEVKNQLVDALKERSILTEQVAAMAARTDLTPLQKETERFHGDIIKNLQEVVRTNQQFTRDAMNHMNQTTNKLTQLNESTIASSQKIMEALTLVVDKLDTGGYMVAYAKELKRRKIAEDSEQIEKE